MMKRKWMRKTLTRFDNNPAVGVQSFGSDSGIGSLGSSK